MSNKHVWVKIWRLDCDPPSSTAFFKSGSVQQNTVVWIIHSLMDFIQHGRIYKNKVDDGDILILNMPSCRVEKVALIIQFLKRKCFFFRISSEVTEFIKTFRDILIRIYF